MCDDCRAISYKSLTIMSVSELTRYIETNKTYKRHPEKYTSKGKNKRQLLQTAKRLYLDKSTNQ